MNRTPMRAAQSALYAGAGFTILRRMRDEPDPPRKFFQLRPTSFERVNPPPADDADLLAGNIPAQADYPDPPADPNDVRTLARQAAAGTPLLGANAPSARDNAIHEVLRENHAHANRAGLNDVVLPRKRRSRRKRDYWLLLLSLDAFFLAVAFGPFSNPVTLIYGLAGFIMYTLGLTWVMWFVMDDY